MIVTGSALACTCGPPLDGRTSSQASFEEAGFVARLTRIGTETATPPTCGAKHWTSDCKSREFAVYSVDEIIKGSPTATVRIEISNGQCVMQGPLDAGETEWLAVFGDADSGYDFGSCMSFHLRAEGKYDPVTETIAVYKSRLASLTTRAQEHNSSQSAKMELAKFLAETHDRLGAISIFDQVLKVDPMHREANILKAKQIALGQHPEAVVDFLAPYLAAHPGDREAMHQNVLALVRADRLDEAPAGWRDFTTLGGINYDFSNRTLNGAVFRDTFFYHSTFAGAELRGADFSGVYMGPADFAGADLSGAVMFEAHLPSATFSGAVLDGADLDGATLSGADLRGASLKGANLANADLRRALYDNATIWPDGFDPIAAGAEKQLQSK